MRTIYLFMMTSLDGYFEGLNHDLSWHNADNPEFNLLVEKHFAEIDTILMGHTTYTLMENFWQSEEALKSDPFTAESMTAIPKIVVTHRPITTNWQNVINIHEQQYQYIQQLKQQPGKQIAIFGSNQLCVSLMEQGLVDEFRIMVNPVALGAGSPLFRGLRKRVAFHLEDVEKYKSGNTLLTYSLS